MKNKMNTPKERHISLNSHSEADDTRDNVLSNATGQLWANVTVNGQPDTGPMADLNYPGSNLLPILNGKVPKKHCSKSCPVYHQPDRLFEGNF